MGWNMYIDEKINDLQNLIRRKISYKEIADVLGLGSSQAVQNRITRKQELKEWEILALDDAFKININNSNQTIINKPNQTTKKYDILEIPYWNGFPEEMKNPQYPFVIAQRCSIESWSKGTQNLCIIAMNGDKLENYWYKIRNNDVLIIDLNETKINANGSGVYFATSRNNTMYWVREMQALYNGDIEFKSYAPSGQDVRIISLEELRQADFKVIGKVIKNVSFTL